MVHKESKVLLGEITRPSLLRNVMLRVVEQAQAPVLHVGVCAAEMILCSLTKTKSADNSNGGLICTFVSI